MNENKEIIESLVDLIGQHRQETHDAIQKLIPLSNTNFELRDTVRELEALTRRQDDRLAELRAKHAKIPGAPEPTNDPSEPTEPNTEQDRDPVSGDLDLVTAEPVVSSAESDMPEPDGDHDDDGAPRNRGRSRRAN